MKYFRRSYIEDMYLKNGVYEAVGKSVPFIKVARQYVPKVQSILEKDIDGWYTFSFNLYDPDCWGDKFSEKAIQDIIDQLKKKH